MSHQLQVYNASDPATQLRRIQALVRQRRLCPQCGRVAKWNYPEYRKTGRGDRTWRCVEHEIIPAPGPEDWPLEERVQQLY